MRILPALLALMTLVILIPPVGAGWRERRAANAAYQANPLVAPNGVATPAWAARRMANSPVPLYGYTWGRRPWAYPLSTQATASANMARADQLGIGAGPIPGYTNGPPLGNYPTGTTGTGGLDGRGYGPGFGPASGYPYNVYLNGAN